MLRVEALTKHYAATGAAIGINGVSFRVERGEFFTLLGPSGCGKTTTLRCIAGLEQPSGGEIEINGRTLYSAARGILVPTARRDISMVFQSYAIWPHMTVGENVAFPLEAQRLGRNEIRERVGRALAMVGLAELAERPAPLLSGGQQQRVALARAIVKGAPVLLLDEPLSNLDAKLREEMRQELRTLQRGIGITAIYVTHDQEEALSLSDRIAVMRRGAIVEMDSPARLYYAPRTVFTARFIGNAELWPCRVVGRSGAAVEVEGAFGRWRSETFPDPLPANPFLAIRPEHVEITRESIADGSNQIAGTIEAVGFSGKLVEYAVRAGEVLIRAQSTSARLWAVGDSVRLRLPPERCFIVDGEAD